MRFFSLEKSAFLTKIRLFPQKNQQKKKKNQTFSLEKSAWWAFRGEVPYFLARKCLGTPFLANVWSPRHIPKITVEVAYPGSLSKVIRDQGGEAKVPYRLACRRAYRARSSIVSGSLWGGGWQKSEPFAMGPVQFKPVPERESERERERGLGFLKKNHAGERVREREREGQEEWQHSIVTRFYVRKYVRNWCAN